MVGNDAGKPESKPESKEEPGFLGGLMSKVTGMFSKSDGSGMNWGSIIGMVAGGAGAMFAGPMLGLGEGIMSMVLPFIGAIAGLFLGKSIGDSKGDSGQEGVAQPSTPAVKRMAEGPSNDIERPAGIPGPPKAVVRR